MRLNARGRAAGRWGSELRGKGTARANDFADGVDGLDAEAGRPPRAEVPAEPAREEVAAEGDARAMADREGELLRGERRRELRILERRPHCGR